MTRPKVPDDKRIRTAQACESCKRRKQKCNGLKPCNTCSKRNLVCDYVSNHAPNTPDRATAGDSHSPVSATKRRHVSPDIPTNGEGPVPKKAKSIEKDLKTPRPNDKDDSQKASENQEPQTVVHVQSPLPGRARLVTDQEPDNRSRHSTVSGTDEVAEVLTETRMLQDPTGRLLYLGDSATLSYLQFIRMIVESLDGPSPFTMDPNRHRLMEATTSIPPSVRAPLVLPDRQTADVLIESYLTNTNGLVEVFDRKALVRQVDICYLDPLAAQPTFLCLLYLVFAIGLVLATPVPGSPEHLAIQRLNAGQADLAEMFFRSAKCLGDPTSGFEDNDFWSVQALLLLSVYMLARTKRNAAYAYHGMAVRSAFALGLHRKETMVIFPILDRAERRNVWRSLYVLDRFLAAALGRPTSIAEEDCSADVLVTSDQEFSQTNVDSTAGGLNAAVRSCQVIGIILKKIYSQRRIWTKLAQEIADQYKGGPQKYHPGLHWRQATNNTTPPAHGIAIMHVNLLYCHAVILLTRPFFLFLMNRMQRERSGVSRGSPRPGSRMEKFSEACVSASYHTIALVQVAYDGRYLPQRNPFVIHFLFAAALVVLSNEFASLHQNAGYSTCINQAMNIMKYCSETDPQANRLMYILGTFHDVVASKAPSSAGVHDDRSSVTAPSPTNTYDPMANFFLSSHGNRSASVLMQSQGPSDLSRRNSVNMMGASPDFGGMSNPLLTPGGGSVAGDLDAECFHFDALWETWAGPSLADPSAAAAAGLSGGHGPMMGDDSYGDGLGGSSSSFATTPLMGQAGVGGRMANGSVVPLYPIFSD